MPDLELIRGALGLGAADALRISATDATVDALFAVPEGAVWYARNVYVAGGELYADGEVKVCG